MSGISSLAGGIEQPISYEPIGTNLLNGNKGLFNIGNEWQPNHMKNKSTVDDQGFDWGKSFGNFGKFMGGITSLAGVINAKDQMKLLRDQYETQKQTSALNMYNQGTAVQNQLDMQAQAQAQMMYGADGGNSLAMAQAAANAPQVRKTLEG